MEVCGHQIELGANLTGAKLANAYLRDANLTDAIMPDGTIHEQSAATRRSSLDSRARQRTMGVGGEVS